MLVIPSRFLAHLEGLPSWHYKALHDLQWNVGHSQQIVSTFAGAAILAISGMALSGIDCWPFTSE
jgi:hypothetical protein